MLAEIFPIIQADTDCTDLLGTDPVRFYPWSDADYHQATKPYATYGTFNGNPQNYLTNTPDIDNLGTQIDVWADSVESAEATFTAIRDALEPHGHLLNFQGVTRDQETKLYTARLEFDFWTPR